MKLTRLTAAVLIGTAAFAVTPAFADGQNATGNITVGLTVNDECTISTNNITFDDAGIIASNIDTSADLTIDCTKRTPYMIGLSDGSVGKNTDTGNRQMQSGSDKVDYQLYSNSGYSTVWGNTRGTDTVDSDSAAGENEIHTIYARVPAPQNVPAGDYSDTVIATIWYADEAVATP